MFPAAVFAAYTARAHASANSFDIFIAVPENAVEAAWIDWAEANVGVHVKEVSGFEKRLGMTRMGNNNAPHLPLSTCIRFFADTIVPSTCERLLYLDADMRVAGDISKLFGLDLGPYVLAACPDGAVMSLRTEKDSWAAQYMTLAGHDLEEPYFNSGTLVIEAPRWRREEVSDRAIANMRENLDRYMLADQSALNSIFRGAFQPISPVWNFMTQLSPCGELSDLVDPAVIHFAGPEKPWKTLTWTQGDGEPAHYRAFFMKSPWRDFCSLWSHSPTWEQVRWFARRRFRERVLGRMPQRAPNIKAMIARYREHVRTFEFADKRQGLVAVDSNGVLMATPVRATGSRRARG